MLVEVSRTLLLGVSLARLEGLKMSLDHLRISKGLDIGAIVFTRRYRCNWQR